MPTRRIRPLPPELTRLLFDLGPRKLILVEGLTDVETFHEWYRLRLSEMEFYPAEGHDKVESFLSEILEQSTTNRAYGIIDRDFRDEPEVETSLAGAEGHLFILRRYALENYLLEPTAIFEELRVYEGEEFTKTLQAIEQDLLDLCRQLKPVMAANWVFWDERLTNGKKLNYFATSFPVDDRSLLIREASKRLECSEADADRLISDKETQFETALTNLETAYTRVDGKRLLELIYKKYRLPHKDYFRRLLARTIVDKLGLHDDIRLIVERRILSR